MDRELRLNVDWEEVRHKWIGRPGKGDHQPKGRTDSRASGSQHGARSSWSSTSWGSSWYDDHWQEGGKRGGDPDADGHSDKRSRWHR